MDFKKFLHDIIQINNYILVLSVTGKSRRDITWFLLKPLQMKTNDTTYDCFTQLKCTSVEAATVPSRVIGARVACHWGQWTLGQSSRMGSRGPQGAQSRLSGHFGLEGLSLTAHLIGWGSLAASRLTSLLLEGCLGSLGLCLCFLPTPISFPSSWVTHPQGPWYCCCPSICQALFYVALSASPAVLGPSSRYFVVLILL